MTERADVLIVGAGPAGLAAAVELKRRGVRDVLVVDRDPEAGGIPRLCHHTGFGVRDLRRVLSGPAYAARYRRLAAEAGAVVRTSTTVTGWAGPAAVSVTSPAGVGQIEAKAVLLATGCRERPRPARLVPGDRPHGVFTTGSLQRLVGERLPVGTRAVIVGAELVSLSALMTLRHVGVAVAALVTAEPQHQVYGPFAPAKWLLIDVPRRSRVVTGARVSNVVGRQRVEAVEVTHTESGRVERFACDTVVFTGDWIPEHELARTGGLAIDAGSRGPQTDAAFRTSTRGTFAAGNLLRGVESASACALEGRAAARSIHEYLSSARWPTGRVSVLAEPPLEWVWPNAIAVGEPSDGLAFRSRAFRDRVRIRIVQGGRTLATQTVRRLVVNETMRLDGRWAATADGGPVSVSVVRDAAFWG